MGEFLSMIKRMKRIIGFIGTASSYFGLALPVFAQVPTPTPVPGTQVVTCPSGQFENLCKLTTSDFGKVLGQLVTLAFIVAVVIALAFLIYGGIRWMVSGGDKTALEEARNHIVASVVGLVIVFLVYFVLNLIIQFFTGQSITNITIPTLR